VRAIAGKQTGYAYADGFAPADLREAARVAARIARDGASNGAPIAFHVVDAPAPFTLVSPRPPSLGPESKIALVRRANEPAPARHDPRVQEVWVGLRRLLQELPGGHSDGLWADDGPSSRVSP